MTCLVTGALGYVGGRLIGHLVMAGHDVIGTTRRAPVMPAAWPAQAALRQVDLLAGDDLTHHLAGVDCVIHLSAANEHRSVAYPDAALVETASATRRLLAAADAAGVGRFVFLSTIHVYGAPLRGELSEGCLTHPMHNYAISHLAGELYVLAAADTGGPTGVVVRLSNAIGAPAWVDVDRWTLLGNDLVRQACRTSRIAVRTPGQYRDFIAMEDVCRGIEILSQHPAARGVYNLAAGETTTVGEIARRTAAIASTTLERPIALDMPDAMADAAPFSFDVGRLRALGFAGSTATAIDREIEATVRLMMTSDTP